MTLGDRVAQVFDWRAVRQHGFLLWLWIKRDLKSRYAGSVGGLLWALLLPVFTVALFYVVFALVLQVRIPDLASGSGYFLYLLAGLLPWLSVADGISRATGSLATQEQFLQKVVFPIEVIPTTAVLTSLVTQVVGSVILLVLLQDSGLISPRLLLLPVVVGCQVVLSLGLGCALAIISVHVKDTMQIVPVILQFMFYGAPILYPKSIIADGYHIFFLLNPVTGLIEVYHWLFLGIPVGGSTLAAMVIWTLLLGVGGFLLFRVLKPTLGDYL